MSLIAHLAVLALLILDLLIGAPVVAGFGGRFAAMAFEFGIILGYVLFVLQWAVPWGRREGEDR